MQKVFNLIAVTSFLFSSAIIATGVYVYNDRENIIENVKAQVMEGVSEALPSMISGGIDTPEVVQELPTNSLPSGLPF